MGMVDVVTGEPILTAPDGSRDNPSKQLVRINEALVRIGGKLVARNERLIGGGRDADQAGISERADAPGDHRATGGAGGDRPADADVEPEGRRVPGHRRPGKACPAGDRRGEATDKGGR